MSLFEGCPFNRGIPLYYNTYTVAAGRGDVIGAVDGPGLGSVHPCDSGCGLVGPSSKYKVVITVCVLH